MKNLNSFFALVICVGYVCFAQTANAAYESTQSYCPFNPTTTTTTTRYRPVSEGQIDILKIQTRSNVQTVWNKASVETFFVRSSGYRRCPVGTTYQVDGHQVLRSYTESTSQSGYYANTSSEYSYTDLRVFYSCWQGTTQTVPNTPQHMQFQLCQQATRCLSYLAQQDPYDLHDDSYGVVLLQRLAALTAYRNCSVR